MDSLHSGRFSRGLFLLLFLMKSQLLAEWGSLVCHSHSALLFCKNCLSVFFFDVLESLYLSYLKFIEFLGYVDQCFPQI